MKKSRHFRTLICLALGLVLLTGSAYANYDNANGYNLYKKALKNFLTVENFTAEGTMELEYNGQVMEQAEMLYMYDRNSNVSEYSRVKDSEGSFSQSWNQNGENIYWNNYGGSPSWHTSTAWNKGFNDDYLSASKEDKEMIDKIINFMELAADTFVGDLKNNFVATGNEGGAMSYQVNLQGQQIPSVINAGLGVLFSSQNYYGSGYDYEPSYVTFADYDALDEDGKLIDEYYEKGYQLLEEKGNKGIACVMGDGSITYYATEQEYRDAIGYSFDRTSVSNIFDQLGTEPVIESANCYLTVDKDGNLLENIIDGTLSGYDADGNKHSYTIRMSFKFYDYGATKIDPVDTDKLDGDEEDYLNWSVDEEAEAEEAEDMNDAVTDDSKAADDNQQDKGEDETSDGGNLPAAKPEDEEE